MIFLKKIETDELSRCQIGTLNKSRGSNIEYLPSNGFLAFAFLNSQIDCVSLLAGQLFIHCNTKVIVPGDFGPLFLYCLLTLFSVGMPTENCTSIVNLQRMVRYTRYIFSLLMVIFLFFIKGN